MKHIIIACFFIALIFINPIIASTNENSTDPSTSKKTNSKRKVASGTVEELTTPSELSNQNTTSTPDNGTAVETASGDSRIKDAFLVEIDYLKEQIDLSQKKIQLIERLRANYLDNNQTVPTISLDVLENSINIDSFGYSNIYSQQSAYVNSILRERLSEEVIRGHGDSNIMNKVFKRYNIEFPYKVKQMVYLPTKSMQRSADEPALAALLVLLTSTNEIVLYSLNGAFLLSFNPGHNVKTIGVNSFTDEYFVVTLGTDNTVRLHNIAMNRVKQDVVPQTDTPRKNEKFKYVLEYNRTLEYIYDLDENKIISEQEAQEKISTRKQRGWSSITSILGRSVKFLALGDENGDLVILNRNGTYKGKFTFPDSKFISIQKHYPHPIYTTDKAVGFFNPNMMEIANPRCDLTGENIVKIELDQFATNEFFVLLQNGDILFYEIKQTATQCRAVAKRSVPTTRGGNPQGLDFFSAKSFLFMRDDQSSPHIFAHNITDVVFASVQDIEYHNISFYPYHTDSDQVVKSDYISVRTSFTASFICAYFEFKNGTSGVAMYELTLPVKAATDWFSNFRMQIVFVAVLLAIGYQFWNRRKKRDDQEAMETLSKLGLEGFGSKGGKGKDLSSLKDSLDSLTKQTNRMSSDLDSMVSGAYSKLGAGLKKAGGGFGDDDDLQEISTKKFR